MISYNDFIANVQEKDLQVLAVFVAATRVRVPETDTAAIAEYRQQCADLFQSGLLDRVVEGYELVGTNVWHTFDGYVNEVAKGYVWQLAWERLRLSRERLPTA